MIADKIIKAVFGSQHERDIKALLPVLHQINEKEAWALALAPEDFKQKTAEFKERFAKGESLDAFIPEAFALAREAARRILHERMYDVQLLGSLVLHSGRIVEMKTGEGKTLMSIAASYLNSLSGKGVHIVTVNDYLAERDADWMRPVYAYLGVSVGAILSNMDNAARKAAYNADITYGTNNEFGFDYLRDNMQLTIEEKVQRGFSFAVVDEIDSILIDEARTPLIISSAAEDDTKRYFDVDKFVDQLEEVKKNPETGEYPNELEGEEIIGDYTLDEKSRRVSFTDAGMLHIQDILQKQGLINGSLFEEENFEYIHYFTQAVRAHILYHIDVDYVVKEGQVQIVDEFTGRILEGRRYSDGLHQAIEAKEHIRIAQRNRTMATITFQNFFRMYDKLSGMTGTAFTEAEEFQQIYGLDVIQIPTNKPIKRIDHEDQIFKTEAGKIKAIVKEVKACHDQGRPVLIGSASIAKNELISAALDKAGLKHETLNAKNNEREAEVIAKAGQAGAITLATNIAGRGTDIMLGEGVAAKGGLVVIGSERHEARRIDNQLRGRGGRQGDPGDTYFYVSTQDDLMRIYQGDRIAQLMERLGVSEDTPISAKPVSKTLEAAQKRVEGYNFDTRKNVVQYDNVINRHRKVVYTIRRKILQGDDISPEILRLADAQLSSMLATRLKRSDTDKFEKFQAIFPLSLDQIRSIATIKNDRKRLVAARRAILKLYDAKEDELGATLLGGAEREIYMQVVDVLWMQHLENMQHLREGIHWRSVGQRDPLVEYRVESQKLFDSLQRTLQEEVLTVVFHLEKELINADQVEDDRYDSDLTKAAASAVEKGVNEAGLPAADDTDESDFRSTVHPEKSQSEKNRERRVAQKKKKQERQNRKKARR